MDTKNKAWLEKGLGKQLLMKMGWKEGEGLGLEGQGRKGNVNVRKIVEQRGLGFSTTSEFDVATAKQIQGLNDVLASLNAEHSSSPSAPLPQEKKSSKKRNTNGKDESKKRKKKEVESDSEESSSSSSSSSESDVEEEEVERKTKGRIIRKRGYQKFLDAKNVSLYSKNDLKAILGGINGA